VALALLGVALAAWPARAAAPPPDAETFFENEVRPVLARNCQKCHGAKKQESGLRLDSRAALLKGGESGPAVVPGKPGKGTLLAAVRHEGEVQMPPGGKLTDPQVSALARWVQMGAPWPDGAAPAAGRRGPINDADRKHWAFRPVVEPPPPAVRDAAWARTPIDRFVLARLEAQNLKPVRPASRRALLRRVTFDLTGLPPTPEETKDFLADDRPGAFDRVVERLLASKAYGERWGRHWLDVARYADTAGDGADYPVREAYKYRNWVIDAFNADKPYDEFLREQIAGDILAARGPPGRYAGRVVATGFLAVGKRYGYDPGPAYQYLDFADAIDSVGRSVLGLSLGCARCHDHKFDPVTMEDYYALYGIFQSTKWAFPGGEELKRPANFPALVPPEEVDRREKLRRDELARIDAALARLKAGRGALYGNTALAGLRKWRETVASREVVEVAYGVGEGVPVNARVQKRGEPDKPGAEVPRRFLEVLGGDAVPPGAGSGRRELAEWVSRPNNPLTARVFVNRVWQWHFSSGLVRTPSDFGTRGEPPTHPELLDWLAARFVASGWSVKELHRLILRSAVYQLASDDDPSCLRADPDNRLLWKHGRRPLDAESLRDAMLAVSGRLDRSRPPAGHPFPPVGTWNFTIHAPFHAVYDSDRRSVYLMVQRNRRHPYLALFDAADPNTSVAERLPTTTPTQALYLMNAPFVHAQAEAFARRLLATPGDDASRVRAAFEAAHCRAVGDAEAREALAFLDAYRRRLASLGTPAEAREPAAWAALGRVLLTANGFLYVD
jgi:mono/diheme cytochrome c family protein